MSVFAVLREVIAFSRCYANEEEYGITDLRMLLLWSSASYIITYVIFA